MTFSILPRTVYKTKSKISGPIEVKEQLGQHSLHVQGMIQSGGIVKKVWAKALKKVQSQKLKVKSCLILGLGGGTAVHLIKQRWPEAKIVGIEIDPKIVKVGKRFFDLNKFKDLKIITADAIQWVNKNTSDGGRGVDLLRGEGKRKSFDLIIVDLYLGSQFPPEAENKKFLNNLKKLLAKNGIAIFNRLKTDEAEGFKEKLEKHFPRVDLIKTSTNLFFLARS